MEHERVVAAVTRWARQDGNIRAVVLTGSVAAPGAADALSDLDIELYAIDPHALLQSSSWYHEFGEVLVVEALPNPGWHPTRLVYYAGGKIDFTIADVDSCTHSRHDRPVRVLVDKDGLTANRDQLQPAGTAPPVDDVEQCINWFYAAALMEAKLLVRRELWQAKFREWDLMRQLLRMVDGPSTCSHSSPRALEASSRSHSSITAG
jgi:aminoglycoside 6-adenylyltransferase